LPTAPTLDKVKKLGLWAWPNDERQTAPRFDPVHLKDIPKDVRKLLTDHEFMNEAGWDDGLAGNGDQAIYVRSLNRIGQFTKKPHPKHLKAFADMSIQSNGFPRCDEWGSTVRCDFLGEISAARLSKITPKDAVCLTVAVRHSVALYFYLQSDENRFGPQNPLWAFQEPLLEPAVYRIGLLTKELLQELRKKIPRFDIEVCAFTGQRDPKYVDQTAEGFTLTYQNALLLKAFLENQDLPDDLRVGDVIVYKGPDRARDRLQHQNYMLGSYQVSNAAL